MPAIELQPEPTPPTPTIPPVMTTRNTPRNQLTDSEKFRLFAWLKDVDLTGIHTRPALAKLAEAALGFTVSPGNAEGALKVVGRELPIDPARLPKPASRNEQILARALVALMTSLGQQPDADLKALAE